MKERLDVLLAERCESREQARGMIMAGNVYINNQKADKPGMMVDTNANIEMRGSKLNYVSRGGLKLEKALKSFNLNLKGCTAIDIGASTGGFTDCMLQNGAKKIYSVDVGYGQLAWSLRQDSRVVNMERTNIRYVTNKDIKELVDIITIDVSFISLKLVLPVARTLLKQDRHIICLIKPQFEAGRDKVGKKGVVRDMTVHLDVLSDMINFSYSIGLSPLLLDYSPIKGPEGNIEYLLLLSKRQPISNSILPDTVRSVVQLSHQQD